MMRRWPAVAIVALMARGVVASQIDVTRYDIELFISALGQNRVPAEVTIELEALEPLHTVELDIEPEKIAIGSVRDSDGKPLLFVIVPGIPNAYGVTNSRLVIDLVEPLERDSSTTITVAYDLTIQPAADRRGFFFDPDHHGSAILSTRNWPYYARYWLPSHDHPSDPAAFRFTLHIPAGVTAAANGALVSASPTTVVWEQSQTIPTYATHIAIGELAVDIESIDAGASDVPLHFYFPPALGSRAAFEAEIERAAEALTYFAAVFGEYPFEKAGFVAGPHPFSMEHASLITLTTPSAAVHEIVHHWWGNAVQIETWGDFWLSEGLTTYFTGFFDEVTRGVNTSCMMTRLLDVAPDQDPMDLYTVDPYCVGAAAVDDHRRWLARTAGRDAHDPEAVALFLAVFRRVYEDLMFDPVTTGEFTEALKHASYRELRHRGVAVTRFSVHREVEEWLTRWFLNAPARPPLRRRLAGR